MICPACLEDYPVLDGAHQCDPKMTLRDRLAIEAMSLATADLQKSGDDYSIMDVCDTAYAWADAMLTARKT